METRSEAFLRKQLDELREHLKQASEEARQAKEQATQAQEQATIAHDLAQKQSDLDRAKIDDLELALRVASLPSLTSPVPTTNLLSALLYGQSVMTHSRCICIISFYVLKNLLGCRDYKLKLVNIL